MLDPARWLKKLQSCEIDKDVLSLCMRTDISDRGDDYLIRFPARFLPSFTPDIANRIRSGLGLKKHIAFRPTNDNIITPSSVLVQQNSAELSLATEEFKKDKGVMQILSEFPGTSILGVRLNES